MSTANRGHRIRNLLCRRPVWTATGLLLTAALFRSSQNTGQTTFALLARERMGVGPGVIGAIGTVAGAATVTAAGLLAAKLSTHAAARAAAAGGIVLSAGLLIAGSATSVAQLTAGMVVLGVAGGLTPPSLATAIGSVAADKREKLLALYATVLSASLVGGPLLETALLDSTHQDVRIPFFTFACLPLVAVGLGLRTRSRWSGDSAPASAAAVQIDDAPAVAPSGPEPTTGAAEATRVKQERARPGRAVLLGTQGGRMALSMQLLYSMPFATVTVFGALIAKKDFGLNAAYSQVGFTVFFVASFASRVVVARRSPIKAKLAVFAVCIALTAAGIGLLALGGPPGVLFAAMALLGVPHGAIFPLTLSLVASSARRDQLAAANAGLFASLSLVSAVTPVGLGLLASVSGYRAMTAAVLVPVMVFTVILMAQRRKAPHS